MVFNLRIVRIALAASRYLSSVPILNDSRTRRQGISLADGPAVYVHVDDFAPIAQDPDTADDLTSEIKVVCIRTGFGMTEEFARTDKRYLGLRARS